MWLLLAKLAGILTTAVTALQPAITTAEEHVEAKLGVLHRHWTLLKNAAYSATEINTFRHTRSAFTFVSGICAAFSLSPLSPNRQ